MVLKVSRCVDPDGVNDLIAMSSPFLEQASCKVLPEFSEPEAQKKEDFKDSLTGTSDSGIRL